jgi:hypothetical protein
MDERRLWCAVLIQAVKDLAGINDEGPMRQATLKHFTQLCFESGSQEPGAFLFLLSV